MRNTLPTPSFRFDHHVLANCIYSPLFMIVIASSHEKKSEDFNGTDEYFIVVQLCVSAFWLHNSCTSKINTQTINLLLTVLNMFNTGNTCVR